jgi:hypothetical protein
MTGMVGPLLFTQVFAFGIVSPVVHLPGAPYLLSSLLLALSLFVALFVTRTSV